MVSLFEIDARRGAQMRATFADLKTCTPLNAVLEGHSPSRIFVDNLNKPSVGFVWTPLGVLLPGGDG